MDIWQDRNTDYIDLKWLNNCHIKIEDLKRLQVKLAKN